MSENPFETEPFDRKLAVECAEAYGQSTGLGCTVSDVQGNVYHTFGQGCGCCTVCEALRRDHSGCIQAHAYGMSEAERFGGKYVYFCPAGLTCFVSPILGAQGAAAKITVGPFLMVELEDYIAYELEQSMGLDSAAIERLLPVLREIPYVSPQRVNALSNLLFMAVSFLNNVSATNRMLEEQDSDQLQGQVSEYILELKRGENLPEYPLETEREMLAAIADSDRPKAQRLLNELLGYILFSSGGDFTRIKIHIYELLVLISRAAVDAGMSPDASFRLSHGFFLSTRSIRNMEDLSFQLAKVMNRFIDGIFSFRSEKNADVMHKALQYLRQHYEEKITLEQTARTVHLSPSYFGKMFKQETGSSFHSYLNLLRVEKAKKLLLYENLPLLSIALLVGFEDQSYFSKVFKRVAGVSPHQYRKNGGRRKTAGRESRSENQ